jgi:hypothetical protein
MKITFVDSDGGDWEGLYIDGKLVMENHRLEIHDVLKAVGFKYKHVVADDEWLARHGSLPEQLSKLKKAKPE